MSKKAGKILSLLLATTLVLTSCGGAKTPTKKVDVDKKTNEVIQATNPEKNPDAAKNRKDTMIIGFTVPNGKFNPIMTDAEDDAWVTAMIFDGLMSNDKEGNPVPWVAEKYEITPDNLTYTFTLRKGVKFTSGDELTAEDVAFTYTAIADPKYDGARADAVQGLVGYKEYNKGDAKTLSGIKVIDPYKISFTFKEVYAPALLNNFGYGIMSKKYYGFEKGGIQKLKDMFLKPMGTGAYLFKQYKTGQEVDFEANPNYFKGAPKIKNLILKAVTGQTVQQELAAGQVDGSKLGAKPANIDNMKKAGFLNMQLYPENGFGYIGLNLKLDMFKDVKVRQALQYGLNRKGFIDGYLKGYADVCINVIPAISWARTDDVNKFAYDPAKANKMLDEAGWAKESDGYRHKDGKKFTIHWLCSTGSKYTEALIPVVQENWKAIGVEVIPELMEFATMAEKVTNEMKFEMFMMGWSYSVDPDPSALFVKEQAVPGGFNSVSYINEENDKMLKDAVLTTDQAKRKEIYTKWAKFIAEEVPYIFLDAGKTMYVVNSRIKGLEISTYQDWTYTAYKAEIAQ